MKKLNYVSCLMATLIIVSCSEPEIQDVGVTEVDVTMEDTQLQKKKKDDNSKLYSFVDDYAESFLNLEPYPPLTPMFPDLTIDQAYDFADMLTKELRKGGNLKRFTGYKLGFTGEVRPFGAPKPVYGKLYSTFEIPEGSVISQSETFIRGSIGFEVAIIIGKNVKNFITPEEAMDVVKAIAPAFEFADFAFTNDSFDFRDIIATNSASRVYILGKETSLEELKAQGIDPNFIPLTGTLDGEVILEARVGLPVGGIFKAVSFLSGELAARGEFLKPGDIILTGAIKGDLNEGFGTYRGDYGVLGTIEFTLVE
ncbi:hypothetical protein BH23BAC2_BH23BAC2_11470 [soil metagenome]